MKNLLIKFLSVILALIFWFSIVINRQNISDFNEPISISVVNISEDQNLSNILPKITLKVDAPLNVLKTLDSSSFKAIVDVKWLSNGEFEKDVIVSSKDSKVRIVSYSPKTVQIKLEGHWTKKVPIVLSLIWQVNENYNIKYSKIKEDYINIGSANSVLNKINELNIKYKLNYNDNDIIKKIIPVLYDDDWNVLDIKYDPKLLNLEIILERIQTTKSFWINPIFKWKLKENQKIDYIKIEPPLVKLTWPEQKLRNLFNVDTEDIDLLDLRLGTKIYTKKLVIPNGIVWGVTKVRIIIKVSEFTIYNN